MYSVSTLIVVHVLYLYFIHRLYWYLDRYVIITIVLRHALTSGDLTSNIIPDLVLNVCAECQRGRTTNTIIHKHGGRPNLNLNLF